MHTLLVKPLKVVAKNQMTSADLANLYHSMLAIERIFAWILPVLAARLAAA